MRRKTEAESERVVKKFSNLNMRKKVLKNNKCSAKNVLKLILFFLPKIEKVYFGTV